MLYNNRNYPHPVLGIGDDVNGTIEMELRVSSNPAEVVISPSFKINNDVLHKLFEAKKISFVSHIYCRGTMFREVFKSDKYIPENIRIISSMLNGEVEIDFLLCANESIIGYKNKDFHKDYLEYKFDLDKGDIIAYAGKGRFFAKKSPAELKSISSLMNISNSEKHHQPMYNDYNGEKITIMLCQEDYEKYQIIKKSIFWVNILLSSIVLPALIEALYFVSSTEAYDFTDKQWYKHLKEIKVNSKDNTEIEIAQRILDIPNNRLFDSIINLIEEA